MTTAKWKWKWSLSNAEWAVLGISTAVKILLFPAYKSTDFEVHRNWLAITASLPLKQWYYEDRSEWTLDYPPFFAWFEFILSRFAQFVDPKMLELDNLGYDSTATVYFQRSTVIVSELVLFFGIRRLLRVLPSTTRPEIRLAIMFLSPCLLFVDHIHFQYNGFMYGILIYSVSAMFEGDELLGGILFAVLLNLKHIYLYQAPAYFVYILKKYCFTTTTSAASTVETKDGQSSNIATKSSFSFVNFVKIGASVATVFAVSFLPFGPSNIPQILKRLFPFKRGLCHAYWAPNFWALYSFADRALLQVSKKTSYPVNTNTASLTRGLVGDSSYAVLPNITPPHTMLLTILFILPVVVKLWTRPTPTKFLDALTLCGFTSFIFGWHVHEKAILLILIPLSIDPDRSEFRARMFYLLSCVGCVSLFPLIFEAAELPIKFAVTALFAILGRYYLSLQLRSNPKIGQPLRLPAYESLYLGALYFVAVATEIALPIAFPVLVQRLEFLPIMMVSVTTAVGVLYVWGRLMVDMVVS
ncbi:glycosyl transferase [Cladochytrium replicatum]|nr:glycosyl transferase [Cladochytrium replicatum]